MAVNTLGDKLRNGIKVLTIGEFLEPVTGINWKKLTIKVVLGEIHQVGSIYKLQIHINQMKMVL